MKKYTILHIENSQNYLNVMKRLFNHDKDFDYQPRHVISGEDAWKKVETMSSLPDLLIVDIMLDNDNDPRPGVDFIRRIKTHERFKDLMIIALTATTKSSPRKILEGEGLVARYYTKTFRPTKWKEEIRVILKGSEGGNTHA